MTHRERRHIETLAGRGWISLQGVRLGDVTYHIDIWQQFVHTAGAALPAARQYAGCISNHDLGDVDLFERIVRLHLETGGYMDCQLDGDRVKAAGVLMRRDH